MIDGRKTTILNPDKFPDKVIPVFVHAKADFKGLWGLNGIKGRSNLPALIEIDQHCSLGLDIGAVATAPIRSDL